MKLTKEPLGYWLRATWPEEDQEGKISESMAQILLDDGWELDQEPSLEALQAAWDDFDNGLHRLSGREQRLLPPKPQAQWPQEVLLALGTLREARKSWGRARQAVDAAWRGITRVEDRIVRLVLGAKGQDPDKARLRKGTYSCCRSPTGVCWYDMASSHGDDECLFCGSPDERK